MKKCTCGSVSVGSSLHSSYCDLVAGNSLDGIECLLSAARSSPNETFYFILEPLKLPRYACERIKSKLGSAVLMSIESGGQASITLRNYAEIIIITLADIDKVRGKTFKGVFIEQQEELNEIKGFITPGLYYNGASMFILDPDTREVLDRVDV